jgi:hypothetical protein
MLIAGLCVAGCREQNGNYCGDAPHTNCMDLDAPCTSDQQCAPNVCDLAGSMTCVQCTSSNPAACTVTTPVCGTDNMCHGCTAHAECGSNVCLPDGSCGDDTSVAYVEPAPAGTDNTNCTKLTPCTTVAKALATNRRFVKFHGTIDEVVSINQNVTLLADPGAKLTSTTNGVLLEIRGSSQVAVYDLEISGASGMNNPGISLPAGNTATVSLTRATVSCNQAGGISATGGTLTVTQSTISGSQGCSQGTGIIASGSSLTILRSTFRGNQGGGISQMNGTFVVIGNVFFNNGGNTSLIGGISIGTSTNAANRLEFNSFALNTTADGVGPAIQCLAGTFNARNNILSDNRTPTAQADQFAGTCTHTFSIMRPGKVPTGNSGSDPLFADPAKGDLHIPSGSPARRAADPGSDLTGIASHDIDGVVRVSPADIGAYEFNSSATSSRTSADGAQR